jgi:uncharacterized protein (DUF1330 family)
MTVNMITLLSNRNIDWFEDNLVNVPPLIRKYSGDYVAFSTTMRKLEGVIPTPHQAAIFTFPSLEAIEDLMSCDEYKPCAAIRKANAEAEMFVFEGDESLLEEARKFWAAGAE